MKMMKKVILSDTPKIRMLRVSLWCWCKFVHVKIKARMGGQKVQISRELKPGVLTGIDSVYNKNAYPVSAVVMVSNR